MTTPPPSCPGGDECPHPTVPQTAGERVKISSPVQRLRRSHQPDHRRRCRVDAQLWPCDAALLIKIVDAIDGIRTDRHPEDKGLSYNDGWNDALDSIRPETAPPAKLKGRP